MTLALLTDFGTKDPFVGILKAVVLSKARAPVQFLDVTHDVPPQDVRTGAFFLKAAAPYLPKGALVMAVVDPGVGSGRAILWGRTRELSFLAPDNGLLSWLDEDFAQMRRVRWEPFALPDAGGTFQGRDVFAPIAAALLSGTPPSKLGPLVKDWVRLPPPLSRARGGALVGEIVGADRFGNCWTTLRTRDLAAGGTLRFKGRALGPVRHHYAQAGERKALAVAGSFGVVELAVRNGDFARRYKARAGDEVTYHG